MIKILTNQHIFEYDIHSLFKAFYPHEDVTIEFAAHIDNDSLAHFDGFTVQYKEKCPIYVSYYKDGTLSHQSASPESFREPLDRGILKNIVK